MITIEQLKGLKSGESLVLTVSLPEVIFTRKALKYYNENKCSFEFDSETICTVDVEFGNSKVFENKIFKK